MRLLNFIKSKLGNKKILFAVLGVGLLLAVVGYLFWGSQSSAAEYMMAKVEIGNLRNRVSATGTLQAVTTVQVGSQASGTIYALYADYSLVAKKSSGNSPTGPYCHTGTHASKDALY